MRNKYIGSANKYMLIAYAIALVVIVMDIFVWRTA